MRSRAIISAIWIIFAHAFASAQPPTVEKVEPPNWWAGHSIDVVRVLVRGTNFQNARVTSTTGSLKVSNVRINDRADYLFFDVAIGRSARFGKYDFEVYTGSGKTSVPFEISKPLDTSTNFKGVNNDDVIYLIMTDRFADGDASNNKDVDRQNPRAWHGGDFRGVMSKLDYLKDLGITAIWLTPWYDNPDEANQCDKPWCPYTNYHGYHPVDYYGVENHFGSMADLQELVRAAHAKGIKVIQDQVANHVAIQHAWTISPPLQNWINPKVVNKFNNTVLLSPNGSASERDNVLNGWFTGNLPDLNQDEPEVARYEIQNALWWVGMSGIDGIRQDTIQYMPRPFIRDWSAAILKQYPKFYMVGEVLVQDAAQTAFFQGGKTGWDGIDTKLPSVFDFKLWQTSGEVFTGRKPVSALRDVLKYDGLYGNINNVTVPTGNHDIDRSMSLPGATIEGSMMHMAFVLSTRGIPQIYYGDEIAMPGGFDPDNRRDFPGGWAADSVSKFNAAGKSIDEQRIFTVTKMWIDLRKKNRALREGKTVDLYYDNDAYLFGRVYEDDNTSRHRENNYAAIGLNISNSPKTISLKGMSIGELATLDWLVSNQNENRSFPSSNRGNVSKNLNGDAVLELPPRSVMFYSANIVVVKEN